MHKYNHITADSYDIDVNLTKGELNSLHLALKKQLAAHGISMIHERVAEQESEFHPDSHAGTLVKLYARIDRALCGRGDWNRRA